MNSFLAPLSPRTSVFAAGGAFLPIRDDGNQRKRKRTSEPGPRPAGHHRLRSTGIKGNNTPVQQKPTVKQKNQRLII